MAKEIFQAFKGVVDCVVADATTGELLVIPPPSTAAYDTGIELANIETVDCAGTRNVALRYPTKEEPKLNLNFGSKTMDILGMKFARKFELGSRSTFVAKSAYLVPPNGLVAASTSGTFGTGVLANAITEASWFDPTVDKSLFNLVQDTDYNAFDPSGAGNELKFAIGQNNAQKWGSGLWGKYVSYKVPIALSNIYVKSSTPFISLSVLLNIILTNGKLTQWIFDASPDSTGSIPITEPGQELAFFLSSAPDVLFLNQLNPC
ncbi:MAG: hypothetical protein KME45_03430 [Stenomitos rutilans HA7619-LM2]|jgi:hypothetical protein|nr:hypothetical protein [Stenomitos rutilans HA7619-LM2]MBW4469437.1 hypothetical protein [Stenomitos rutilans HA7619-LM2]